MADVTIELSRWNINKFIKKVFSLFIDTQIYLCNKFDKIMPERFRVDGHQDFKASFVPKYLRPRLNLKVYDVGGARSPTSITDGRPSWGWQSSGWISTGKS